MSGDGVSFDPFQMGTVPGRLNAQVDAIAENGTAATPTPDAGFSTAAVGASLAAVADAMRMLSGELQLVADNVTGSGSMYADTDDGIAEAVRRAGGEG